jgi:hypothetical protein
MMYPGSARVSLAIAIAAIGVFGGGFVAAEGRIDVVGVWRGESICASNAGACHNENVIYSIKEIANRPAAVFIQADKIVDGRTVTMGSSEWRYDRAEGTLEWRTDRQTWRLKVMGNRIEGSLTLADGTVFRKVTLEKDK